MYAQGGVTYTPSANAFRRSFSKRNCLSEHVWGTCPVQPAPFGNPIFSLIVHACSCYQSENISFLCLLKRVIDPSVLNHFIRYDNNAIRITCQEVFVDFLIQIKYDMLINTKKSNERRGYTKLWSFMKRKSVF